MTKDVPQRTIDAFGGDHQRALVFWDRYSMRGPSGEPVEETPQQMWTRVSNAIGQDTKERNDFYEVMLDWKFVPAGRILAGAGTDSEVTLGNCFVIPVETQARRAARAIGSKDVTIVDSCEYDGPTVALRDTGSDSREAIIDTIGVMVDIMSKGGGVGINWSVLRPRGAHLKRINATSSGPVDWMHFASTAVGTVMQGGSRRGAAMFMLDVWHPDIVEFIEAKTDLTRIENANLSVCITDPFMEAVQHDWDWPLVFPDTTDPDYNTEWDGDIEAWRMDHEVVVHRVIKARELWDVLAKAAWDNGEPGVFFIDRANELRTGNGRLIATNPCGEMPLEPYDVCNLGSMNLAAYVEPAPTSKFEEWREPCIFNWGRFRHDVRIAVRFLDNVIDATTFVTPENEQVQKGNRRIGLGVMGLADALVLLGYRYGSDAAVVFTSNVFEEMKKTAVLESGALAMEKGPAPNWRDEMRDRPYLRGQNVPKVGLRNLYLLTQAPTGTTAILAGVNGGIEPYFDLGYWRTDRTGRHWMEPAAVKQAIHDAGGTEGDSMPWLVTADKVPYVEHIGMQAAAQQWIDNSVSKTINAPNSHTVEDVKAVFSMAYYSGLKGMAYFREGCRRAAVLTKADKETTETPSEAPRAVSEGLDALHAEYSKALALLKESYAIPFERPTQLKGRTHKVRTAVGTAYVTVNGDEDGKPVEVFVNVGKAGTDLMCTGEALGRLMTLALQRGATLMDVADQLDGIGGINKLAPSLPHALAMTLSDIAMDIADVETGDPETWEAPPEPKFVAKAVRVDILCPQCGQFSVVREEGCVRCRQCDWTRC